MAIVRPGMIIVGCCDRLTVPRPNFPTLSKMELIYCANGNKRFAEIAISAGFLYGAQMPGTVHYPPFFCDQNWKKPNRAAYMKALAEHKPALASVLDWERPEQLPEVLGWAEEAAQHVDTVMLIPKVQGGIASLPRTIGGKPVRLGYSVPTRFGGTELPLWEFAGRDIHLLGGSPSNQLHVYRHLRPIASVKSADGNYANMKATKFCQWWDGQAWRNTMAADGQQWGTDAPYEAFTRSCENILKAWRKQ